MADITITATDVVPSTGVTLEQGTAGEAISAGDFLYKDSTDSNKLKKAVNTTDAASNVVGMALVSAADDAPVTYTAEGQVTIGSVLASAGKVLVLSGTAGKCGDDESLDISSTEFVTLCGVSVSATVIALQKNGYSGVAHA